MSRQIKKTQNRGVNVATESGITYYGVLIDIIELNYSGNIRRVIQGYMG